MIRDKVLKKDNKKQIDIVVRKNDNKQSDI